MESGCLIWVIPFKETPRDPSKANELDMKGKETNII